MVGVNVVGVDLASDQQQDALIVELHLERRRSLLLEKVDANRKADPGAIFRCGALTAAGKLALATL